MVPIYYIQLEDKNIDEGHNSNNLAGLDSNFAGKKEVLVFSNHASEIKDKYASSGVKTTIYQNENFSVTNLPAVTNTLRKIFVDKANSLIVFDKSNLGNSLGSQLAAVLNVPFIYNAKDICCDQDHIIVNQDIGKTQALRKITLNDKAIISLSCNGVVSHSKNEVDIIDWECAETNRAAYVPEANSDNDLAYAKVIVAGGKGLGSPDKFKPLATLAQKLNASVGATKAVTDQGWIDKNRMIGISNLSVAPDVYYAFGISGAVQHTAGMTKSKCVIAVNTDEAAPIFKLANYGIVGDANQVIKQLNELL